MSKTIEWYWFYAFEAWRGVFLERALYERVRAAVEHLHGPGATPHNQYDWDRETLEWCPPHIYISIEPYDWETVRQYPQVTLESLARGEFHNEP